jgi:hypothetical protein
MGLEMFFIGVCRVEGEGNINNKLVKVRPMKQHYFLLLLLLTVSTAHAQIDLGENNVRYLTAPMGGETYDSKFSPDGKYVALYGRDGFIHTFEIASGAYLWKSDSTMVAFDWSPDGMTIVTAKSRVDSYDSLTGKTTTAHFLQFCNASNGKFVREVKVKNEIYDLSYSKQGDMIIVLPNSSTDSFYIEFINPMNGEIFRQSSIKRKWYRNLHLDKIQSRIVIFERRYKPSGFTFGLVVLNAETGDSLSSINLPPVVYSINFAFIPNTDLGVITQAQGFNPRDSLFYLINIFDGSIVREYPGMKESIAGIDVTNDGNHLITCDARTDIFIWDVHSGQVKYVWHKLPNVLAIALSPDERYIVGSGSLDSIALWPMPQISDAPVTGDRAIATEISCRPNPANEEVEIRWQHSTKDRGRISILNMLGEEVGVVYEGTEAMGERRVDIAGLSNGQYMIVLRDGEKSWVEPLVIAR